MDYFIRIKGPRETKIIPGSEIETIEYVTEHDYSIVRLRHSSDWRPITVKGDLTVDITKMIMANKGMIVNTEAAERNEEPL